ncbi:hypothetical protein IFM89_020556 [Coptis chinensis]|uniref:Uncharacterized protein n=1 Tax=Coptis chinensis TaxID=261450 RepID=A0A835M045_9MAGN|nr:hypothetical protein IFM89_020556 [Coptis chinensis]
MMVPCTGTGRLSIQGSRVPIKSLYHIVYQRNTEKLFKCPKQRFLAKTSDRENIVEPLLNQARQPNRPIQDVQYASHSEADFTSKNDSLSQRLNELHKFARPETLNATIVAVISVCVLPVETLTDLTPKFFMEVLKVMIPTVLMNTYVMGLNQVNDVESDKCLAMGYFYTPPLRYALLIFFLLGTAYSVDLPFFYWKKNPFLASGCIVAVRALVIPVAFFVHIQKYAFGRPLVFTRSLVFGVSVMFVFSALMALLKDVPDVEGDLKSGYHSISVKIGAEKVFRLCINVLLMTYGISAVLGAFSTGTVLCHCTFAYMLWLRARSVDFTNKASVTSMFKFLSHNIYNWKDIFKRVILTSCEPPEGLLRIGNSCRAPMPEFGGLFSSIRCRSEGCRWEMQEIEVNLKACVGVSVGVVSWMVFSRPTLRKIIPPHGFVATETERDLFMLHGL